MLNYTKNISEHRLLYNREVKILRRIIKVLD